MSTEIQQRIRVAILDDYQNVAPAIFARRLPEVETRSFNDTLDAQDPKQRGALIERLRDFQVISTMRERTAFPPEVVSALPQLRLVLTTGMVNAAISLDACQLRHLPVIGTKGKHLKSPDSVATKTILSASLQATAEQTLALILAVTKLIPQNCNSIANGGWQTGLATGLAGKTLGLVGLGRVGGMVARMASLALGMRVIAWSRNLTQEEADRQSAKLGLDTSSGVRISVTESKADLFREADVVSLHYVLSERSRGIVGREELAAMKPTAVLVNTSRGGLIDEPELLETLKQGRIAGVGLDVFTTEPLPAESEWRTVRWGENGAGNAVLAPHMGYSEERVIEAWYKESADNLAEWLDGKMPDAVIV